MLFIDETDKAQDLLYKQNIIDYAENELEITVVGMAGWPITGENIVSESMVLKQSICDEDKLKFGGCIASEFSIQLMNTEDRIFSASQLKGKYMSVRLVQTYYTDDDLTISDNLTLSNSITIGKKRKTTKWTLFRGIIDSVIKNQDDKNILELVAYDILADLHKVSAGASLWSAFKHIMNNTAQIQYTNFIQTYLSWHKTKYGENIYSVKENILGSFYPEYGISMDLHNPGITTEKPTATKGDVIRWLCEIENKFCYYSSHKDRIVSMKLNSDYPEFYDSFQNLNTSNEKAFLYDSALINSGNNFLDTENKMRLLELLQNSQYQSFLEEDVELSDYNYYDLTENVMAWDTELCSYTKTVNFLQKAQDLTYIPFTATVEGRPWVEVGDAVRFEIPKTNIYGEYIDSSGNVVEAYDQADKEVIESYVFSRTLKGIKALTDEFETRGDF